jgi:hypothetical protein
VILIVTEKAKVQEALLLKCLLKNKKPTTSEFTEVTGIILLYGL